MTTRSIYPRSQPPARDCISSKLCFACGSSNTVSHAGSGIAICSPSLAFWTEVPRDAQRNRASKAGVTKPELGHEEQRANRRQMAHIRQGDLALLHDIVEKSSPVTRSHVDGEAEKSDGLISPKSVEAC